jgi:hypothetical protein
VCVFVREKNFIFFLLLSSHDDNVDDEDDDGKSYNIRSKLIDFKHKNVNVGSRLIKNGN